MIALGTFEDTLEAVEGTAVSIQVGVEEMIQLLALPCIQQARDKIDEDSLSLAARL